MNSAVINALNIKLEAFEGPLDLLFHLIEKHKIDIYDIPIAQLTDQYMEYIYAMNQLNIELASEFLVMAATLLQIKSKMLLPVEKEELEDGQAEDPRDVLVRKLIEYRKYKNISSVFSKNEAQGRLLHYKFPEVYGFKRTYILEQLEIGILAEMYNDVLARNREKVNVGLKTNVDKILKIEKVTLSSKINHVIKALKEKISFKFSELFNVKKVSKTETVTGFMAILELSKIRCVALRQKKLFDDIEVERLDLDRFNTNMKDVAFEDD